MLLGCKLCCKEFYEIDTCGQFNKTFLYNQCCYQHIALSFYSGYTARGGNYAENSFMKKLANFIKLFSVINAANDILSLVFTKVMPLGL
jgi:hypothetical protein